MDPWSQAEGLMAKNAAPLVDVHAAALLVATGGFFQMGGNTKSP